MAGQQTAVWRNVHARYPGVTEEVWEYYWRLMPNTGLENEEAKAEFVRMLLAKWPDGVDLTDLAKDPATCEPSKDPGQISDWAVAVANFQEYVEAILDGNELIPFDNSKNWLNADRFGALKEENRQYREENEALRMGRKNESDSIEVVVASKRKTSIYRMIYGISVSKYHFNPDAPRNSATRNIAMALHEAGVSVDEGVILSVLKDAASYVKNNA